MQPETIAGRYTVERAVGRGGMGTVWLCRDEVLGRTVAVKEVGSMPGTPKSDIARALREARSSAAINHPNVVSVFDAIQDDEHNWLVMEYVPSRTLSEVVAEEGALSPARVAWIGAQAADGLAAAHERGTIHRDVKPSNILITADDHAKITDFGLARTHGDPQLTASSVVTGTPAFFAPELAKGGDPTLAADVWGLGASLYTAVEGRLPYPDQVNAIALLTKIAHEPPPRPERAEFLTEPIERMMDPDPSTRWSMSDAAHALHRLHEQHRAEAAEAGPSTVALAAQEAVTPEPEAPPEDSPPPPTPVGPRDRSDRRTAMLTLTIVAIALVAVGSFLLLNNRDETPAANEPRSSTSTESGQTEDSPDPDGTGTPEGQESSSSEPAAFVEDYYANLPDDPDTSWALLSPAMQDRIGYDTYVGFWRTVSRVQVDDTSVNGQVVDVDLTYTTDRGTESETRRLRLEQDGDSFLIAGDEVV